MRPRSQTIGTLGRAPARQSQPPSFEPPARDPVEPPPPERGLLRRWIHGALFDNVGLKFLSLVLALTVFLLVNNDRDREVTVHVGVKYNYPADKVLVSDELDEVRVTIKGTSRRLRQVTEHPLDRIDLDVSKTPTGEVEITPDMIDLPPGLTVTSISPRTIRVAFDKRVERLIEIEPATTGRPQHGLQVSNIRVTPATIKVHGGERLLAALTAIRTTEVSLDARTESFEAQAPLIPPEGVTFDAGSRLTVSVRVDIQDELVTKKLAGIALEVRGDKVDAAKWTIDPPQVEVTLIGKLLDVEGAQGHLTGVVRVGAAETKAREADVVIEGIPASVLLGVRISPDRVKLTPVR
jgi:YbbR domain-containing protein